MALPNEVPWTSAEKNYMLAEIIKASNPPPNVLLYVVTSQLGIQQPSWNEIPMPPGRSLNSCRMAFEDLRRMQPISMLPAHYGTQTPSPMSAPLQLKRPYSFEGPASYPVGREIRPKPTSGGSAFGPISPIDNPPRARKRGRPTKAEAQAKEQARGVPGPPVPAPRLGSGAALSLTAPVAPAPGTLSTFQPPAGEPRTTLPPVTRVPISSIVTPIGPQTTSQSSSSSGKRKRGRSTRSDPEEFQTAEAARASRVEDYESPYGRVAAASQDTPAGAALLRQREEFERESEEQSTTQPTSAQAQSSYQYDPNIQ